MYVYRTNAFDEQVKEQTGLGDHVDRLCREIEEMALEQVLARFERVYPYLKRKEGNLRLIARIKRVGSDPVLCWLKVFRRGDHAYGEFLRDRENFGDRILDGQIKQEQLWQWLNQRKAENDRQNTPQPLSDELRLWLQRPSLRMDFDGVVVYESERWLNSFSTPEIQDKWRIFNRIIAELADTTSDFGSDTHCEGIKLYGEEHRYVLYSRILTADTPSRQVLFLIAPFSQIPDREQIQQVIDYTWPEKEISPFNPQTPTTLDELTSIASRAYPSYLLADETNWLAIENEENANLALSAEEEAILHDVSTTRPSLPLFLNGQAGSGKSTMLFHLFADYCHKHSRLCQEQNISILSKPHPLFLAYNERLLKVAKERVIPLLASHHRFLAKRGIAEDLPNLSPFFQSFRTFLQNLLPLEERDRFNDANYISFHRFRQLIDRTTWRKYSPELYWQVIRTFIKGYHLDERDRYLDVDDYREIPRREQTVTVEEFKDIYETVWKWYERYAKESEKWDDQDLIRRVLFLKCYAPEYTAIFCDEAQDFTHIELQLIMRLSVFTAYDLEHQHIESLPFAFAGDPLQTLNPTGFRWASLKAAFYNEVITTLSPTGKLGLEMNFAELESNYRSIPAIVGVNNLIQLWRSVLFDLPELKPQKARKHGDFNPKKLIVGQDISLEELEEYLQDTIIIIPCDQGGESDYIRKDNILAKLQEKIEKQGILLWNVLSAIAAKGLEFKQVVLYKFGESCNLDAWLPMDSPSEEVKYFFNKLYVAASRATERLFIIDTEVGDRKLWKHASNILELEKFLELLQQQKSKKQWEERIYLIGRGDRADAIGSDDLPEIANTFFTEGINMENADLIRRSQSAYKRLEDEDRVQLCEAWALRFEEKYLQAGECFLQQQEFSLAWNCFWQGMCWANLLAWYDLEQNELKSKDSETLEVNPANVMPLIKFMVLEEDNIEGLQQFSEFLAGVLDEKTTKNIPEKYRFTAQWKMAIQTYGKRIEILVKNDKLELSQNEWSKLGKVLEKLAWDKYQGMSDRAGSCCYRAQEYDRAISFWEEAKSTQKVEYNLAKAESVGFPAGLPYLLKADRGDLLISAWESAQRPFSSEWLIHLAPILEGKEEWLEAISAYEVLGDREKMKMCLEGAKEANRGEEVLQQLLSRLLTGQKWDMAIDFIETYPTTLMSEKAKDLNLPFSIVRDLAYSELSPQDLSRGLRRRYELFFKEKILFHSDWEQFISPSQLGITLEKVGSLVETLSFYERYTHHENKTLAIFARSRWLAVKKKQEAYLSQQGQVKKAVKSRSELAKKSKIWGIPLKNISLLIPVPPADIPEPEPKPKTPEIAPAIAPSETIAGLPDGVKINSSQADLFTFQLRHLEVKVMPIARQILLRDRLTEQQIRFDGQLQQLNINTIILQIQGQDSFTFADAGSGYQGKIDRTGDHFRLELNLSTLSEPIIITL
ncbi:MULTISPECIES: hypothetical protein [Spirulina sp. CCY15215]|uniref:hypothetical protein n=1 Tax=Spirulina sp. CCY15215 TaxID=2767591 RepID=UPI00194F08CC|nr:hypothetical protein [Spirulina major]